MVGFILSHIKYWVEYHLNNCRYQTRTKILKTAFAAERQRRYREKRKKQPEKDAEVKRKDLERYHALKKLV